MLHHLLTYAMKHNIASEAGFTWRSSIKWLISFDDEGRNPIIIPPGEEKVFAPMLCPDAGTKAQGKAANFLADKARVVACYTEKEIPDFLQGKHGFFLDMLDRAGDEIAAIKVAFIGLSSAENISDICRQLNKAGAKKDDYITLRIGDRSLVDFDDWHSWWRSEYRKMRADPIEKPKRRAKKTSDKFLMRCLLTGELVEPVKSHESTIGGLKRVGGRGGERIISFDKDAFQSFYLPDAYNAAASEETAKIYVTALNKLISSNSVNVSNAIAVYWFKKPLNKPQEEDIFALFNTSEADTEIDAHVSAKKLFESIREGKRPWLLDNEYYSMLISGASARVMLREWSEGSFVDLVQSMQYWFDTLEIIQLNGRGVTKWSSLERVITCLLPPRKPNQKYEDWIKPISGFSQPLWHAALHKDAVLPYGIIGRIVPLLAPFFIEIAQEESKGPNERSQDYNRIFIPLLHRRMGLLKAFHIRKKQGDSDMITSNVNLEHKSQAYHCGRLLAVLARLQRTALGKVGSGVIQRYYAAASQTPGLVLGRLLRNAQNHLSKDTVKNPDWFESWISEISLRIGDSAPTTLSLEQQSLFALGYYQQLAELNKRPSNDFENGEGSVSDEDNIITTINENQE